MTSQGYVDHLAFPELTDSEMESLAKMAKVCTFRDGEPVFEAGRRGVPLYVVDSGHIEIVDESTPVSKSVVIHGPRSFTGDVSLLTDRPAIISAYARGETRAYCVSQQDLRKVIQQIPELSDKLLEAFQMRRYLLERSGFVGTRVIGRVDDPDLTQIREFFDKNKIPHTWIDADTSDGQSAMKDLEIDDTHLPFVACNRGTRSPRPTVTRLAECLGLKRPIRTEPFDLVIVGAGPAGLAAAVYGASEGLSTLLLDRFGPGGQASTSSRIENYMGFPAGLTGADLANRGYLQALKFGAELVAPVEVRSMSCEDKIHKLVLDDGQVVSGRSVLIATGASYQRLPIDGCERWDGAGVYYSCTSVHARSCKEGRAVVVGGGNSAGQAAMFLAEHTAGVSLLLRGGDLRKSMSDYLARRIESHPKIEVLRHVEIAAIDGQSRLNGVTVSGSKDGSRRTVECNGVFVFIGARPRTEWLPRDVAVDSKGFILTGADAAKSDRWPLSHREPCIVETTCPGVFAAGDVRSNTTKRVAFAVGDGALAVTCAHRVLAEL
ncbi:FAD-dependent oxidoreductase [Aquisphaera insulae]|uniref:FAD-dependent oxidoreductase n=1 Tax=Aquisphaera insulae TaxID=2712864 RepID=UPI00196B3D77|nr:cyclic nucleotide-binding domain-containing thioredoxin-disulfide reductase [Aquisphaera insulae]